MANMVSFILWPGREVFVGLGWVGLHESWSNPQHGRFNGSIELESKSLIYYYFLLDVDETKEA